MVATALKAEDHGDNGRRLQDSCQARQGTAACRMRRALVFRELLNSHRK